MPLKKKKNKKTKKHNKTARESVQN
jgi:hypothetical protein